MAEEKKVEKIILEREYNVPLRSAFIKVPKYRKSNKAVLGLREFIKKHMKADSLSSVKIAKEVNENIWERGIKSPPHHVKVKATKYETYVAVSLVAEAVEKKDAKAKKSSEKTEKVTKEKSKEPKAEAKAKPKLDKKEENTKLESFSKKEAKVEDKKEKPAKKAEAKKE